jgi:D-alanyl-D-alanine carboxypeptidase (penicillin-binding protein 5/6)
VAAPIVVTLPQGEGGKPQTRIERADPLIAPLAKGQRVGTLKVSTAAGQVVASVPLIAIEEVPEAGLIGRAWDAFKLWIK